MRIRGDQASPDEINSAFNSGDVFDAKPEQLERYLLCLASIRPNNQDPKTTSILRTLIINHIQMAGVIRDLNIQNGITATAVKRLTVLAVFLAALQVFCAGFFIWRDFHPRDVPVYEEPVSGEAERDARITEDESTSPEEPIRE